MQSLRELLIGTFALLPNSDVGNASLRTVRELLDGARLLKRWADEERPSVCRKDHGKSTPARPPPKSCKVFERCSRHEQDRVDTVGLHQAAGFFLAIAALLSRYWMSLVL